MKRPPNPVHSSFPHPPHSNEKEDGEFNLLSEILQSKHHQWKIPGEALTFPGL